MKKDILQFALGQLIGAGDAAGLYGHSKQYWSRLMNTGVIPSQKTAAGRITTRGLIKQFLAQPRKKGRPKLVSNHNE